VRPAPVPSPAAQIEHAMLADPVAGRLFAAIKRADPAEFSAVKAIIVQQLMAHKPSEPMWQKVNQRLFAAERQHQRETMQASHEFLVQYRNTEIAMVEALHRADQALCATYMTTGSFHTRDQAIDPRLMVDFRTAAWDAFAAGHDHPVHRIAAQPSENVSNAIIAAMKAQAIPEDQARAFLSDPHAKDAMAAPQQCETGLAFIKAINGLPDDQADQTHVFLIQQSLDRTAASPVQ